MSICLRYARHRPDAEEILNDTFYKLFKTIDQFDTDRPLKPWIGRLAVNTAIDFNRKKKNMLSWLELIPEAIQHFITQETEDNNEESELLKVLQALSPQYRMVFNLYVFESYTHAEIAKKLGIAVGTSKSNYARAKDIIRNKLNDSPEFIKLVKQRI